MIGIVSRSLFGCYSNDVFSESFSVLHWRRDIARHMHVFTTKRGCFWLLYSVQYQQKQQECATVIISIGLKARLVLMYAKVIFLCASLALPCFSNLEHFDIQAIRRASVFFVVLDMIGSCVPPVFRNSALEHGTVQLIWPNCTLSLRRVWFVLQSEQESHSFIESTEWARTWYL